jgi:hypothetical protein
MSFFFGKKPQSTKDVVREEVNRYTCVLDYLKTYIERYVAATPAEERRALLGKGAAGNAASRAKADNRHQKG